MTNYVCMKTSHLTGDALNWVVMKLEGYAFADEDVYLCPSDDWDQARPIIEREKIDIWYRCGVQFMASIEGRHEQSVAYNHRGNPMLIAAMRCYVASKIGDLVDIPEELT